MLMNYYMHAYVELTWWLLNDEYLWDYNVDVVIDVVDVVKSFKLYVDVV